MKQFTVTVIETAGIQDYIFGSNNLKHNVGASALVHWATHNWVYEALVALGTTTVNAKGKFSGKTIEGDSLSSELIYAGGGNTVIIFQSIELAQEFTRRLTRRALLEAPGLQLIVAHQEFDWDADALTKMVQAAIEKVSRKKANRVRSSPILGLGVTADCQYTGLPAVEQDLDGRRISAEVKAKQVAFEKAHERLIHALPLDGFDIPKDFDDFGRTKGESSYIAVIHTDGNSMGKRIHEIANAYLTAQGNRPYIDAIRAFSHSIENEAKEALDATAKQLLSVAKDGKIGGVIEIHGNKIPFRPIVFGGDDVTFVCDGRLSLTLTEFYLRQITARPLADGKRLSVRAGVAVVKSHFPFARAYALAEELTKSAKKYIRRRQALPFNEQGVSALDWHFAVSGTVLDLEQIREREYTVEAGQLTMRPLRLGPPVGSDWHAWETFTHVISEFRDKEEWVGRRNKVKALRDALRAGPEAVKQFVMAYEPHHLPAIPGHPDSAQRGWEGNCCTCFDAIEALDFFVPLEGGKQ